MWLLNFPVIMKKVNIFIFFFVLITIPLQKSFAQKSPCPDDHEKTKQYLKEYLSDKKNIDNLQSKRNMNVDKRSFKKIRVLQEGENKNTCAKLLDNAPWLKNFDHYTFYRTDNYYFIVMYTVSDKIFTREGIAIFNKEFKREVTHIES